MSLTADIYDAFAPMVTTFAASQSPSIPVGYHGTGFDPPDSGMWVEIIPFWSGSENYGLADAGPSNEQGFFRLLVGIRPSPAAMMAAQIMAEKLVTAFSKGATFGPARVYQQPAIGGPLQSDNKVEVPVTIRWRATR